MKIDQILKNLQTPPTTKEASAPASTETQPSSTPTAAAAAAALAAAPTAATKTASVATNPVNDVLKVAQEIAASDKEAQIKHASAMGAAFADAFIARLGAHTAKVASVQPAPGTTAFGKFAAENPGLAEQAAVMGYTQTRAEIEKRANEAHDAGYAHGVDLIHKTAAAEFLLGAQAMDRVIARTQGA